MSYTKLNNCWLGLKLYNLNGNSSIENYNDLEMSLPKSQKYNGTDRIGSFLKHNVNQVYGLGFGNLNNKDPNDIIGGRGGLGWV